MINKEYNMDIDLAEIEQDLSDTSLAYIKEEQYKIDWVNNAIAGDIRSKNNIYNQYYKMVKTIVYNFFIKDGNNFSSSILEIEDYEQEAWCYLFKNLDKYDPSRSKLSTFIYMRTEACLQRYRENNARTIRYPVYKVQLFNRMKKFCAEYEYQNSCYPSDKLLKKEFNVGQKEIQQFMEYSGTNLISLEQTVYDNDDKNTLHSVLNAGIDVEANSLSAILIDEIKHIIFTSEDLKREDKEFIKMWLFDEVPDKEMCNYMNIKKSTLTERKEKVRGILQSLLIDFKKVMR